MSARFKLDENLPRDAEALLRKAGHDVRSVLDEQLGGNLDPRVFEGNRGQTTVLPIEPCFAPNWIRKNCENCGLSPIIPSDRV